MRLNRYLAQTSGLSRRAADEAIEAGRVQVNGQKAVLGLSVSGNDEVQLDGQTLAAPEDHIYIIYHKPVGEVVSHRQQGKAPTIYQRFPSELQRLRSVGRLDRDSSGLLVLTNDGDYAHRQTHPSFEKMKRYEVSLSKALSEDDANHLRNGVTLEDGNSSLGLEAINDRNVVVAISEGRNRQIRRSFAALGYDVTKLHRTDFGELKLGDLKPGEWRHFTPQERPTDA